MTEQNPYAPPKATVEDVLASGDQIPPCPDVERACMLFWVSFGVGTISEIFDLFRITGSDHWYFAMLGFFIGCAFGFLITWWITRKLRAGRNWMRWLITIVNVASYLAILVFWDFFSLAFRAYSQNVTAAIFAGMQMLIGGAGLVLLFTRASRDWFDEQSR
jgi:hypothetical protein